MLLVRRRARQELLQDGIARPGSRRSLDRLRRDARLRHLLAFQSYDTSRSVSEAEAQIVMQQFETAQFLPSASGEAVGRPRLLRTHRRPPGMARDGGGTLGSSFNLGSRNVRTMQTVEAESNASRSLRQVFDQRSDRENARVDRVTEPRA